ncbi:maleate cis-trans isomerase family protein [Pigmentiphaga kullae]|uniref:Maleate isomerase n=1 Tax=Pigmentiphaga kullae TaxID=151784 RepID=A0A4V2F2N6_9BURK|nr:arylmalonate decarboxylase [Pigmentiphaga kullae]RZS78778.1 maleate isomerase [Pigmentiphaga kullae]
MDHLGYRMKFGVIGPSTNTIVQPDFDDMRPVGVTNHYSRIEIPDFKVDSDESFVHMMESISGNTMQAASVLKTCEMQYLIMGMSAVMFWGGKKGAQAYLDKMREHVGVEVSCGSFALEAALNAYGARRIAFLSPYYPVANAEARQFFEDCGFTVVRDICLRRPSPVQIAHTTDQMCRDAINELNGDDVDAIVQLGTNLSMVRLAAAAELFLDKPIIAINTATYWHALRQCGIQDKVQGLGRLLSHY